MGKGPNFSIDEGILYICLLENLVRLLTRTLDLWERYPGSYIGFISVFLTLPASDICMYLDSLVPVRLVFVRVCRHCGGREDRGDCECVHDN